MKGLLTTNIWSKFQYQNLAAGILCAIECGHCLIVVGSSAYSWSVCRHICTLDERKEGRRGWGRLIGLEYVNQVRHLYTRVGCLFGV